MLELRPNCELCDKDLAPTAKDAFICTYECTFCQECVDSILMNVCPNCGGNFCPRPIRPAKAYRKGLSLNHQPSSSKRVHTAFSKAEIIEFSNVIKHLEPYQR
jgi:hypothetical protein